MEEAVRGVVGRGGRELLQAVAAAAAGGGGSGGVGVPAGAGNGHGHGDGSDNAPSTLEVLMGIHQPGVEPNLTFLQPGMDKSPDVNIGPGLSGPEAEVEGARSLAAVITIGCVLALLDLTTVLGNLLVCVTICARRRLRSTTNYFVFSLALSDLLLGVIVLPFSTLNTIIPEWPLGSIFCNIFISTDVMLCTVSILNLFAISLERYFAVSSPMRYSAVLNFRLAMGILAAIWIFSFVMAFIPIHLGWNTEDGNIQNEAHPELCLFEGNIIYVLLVSVLTYFVPLIVMCVVYVKVFIIAREQVQRINQLVKQTIRVFHQDKNNGNAQQAAGGSGGQSDPRLASDSKATVTLASVVTAFAICWIPYFVIFASKPFLTSPIDPTLDLFALWLGYVNSMLNPFLYAFHSTQFRDGFISVLTRKPMANPHSAQFV